MQTILVPTDFNPASIDYIPAICKQVNSDKLTLIFVHMFKLSDSMGELLMLSKRSREYQYISEEFYTRLNKLKADHPQIEQVKIEFLYGSTVSLFKNFIEQHEVDYVVDPDLYEVKMLNRSSINPAVMVKKSGLPVLTASKADSKKGISITQIKEEMLEVSL